MTGAAHWCAGWIVGGLLTGDPALAFAAGLIALAPDIDHPHSTISRRVIGGELLRLFVAHRGFTHSLASLAMIFIVAAELVPAWALLIVAALASHIVCDMMTPSGVSLLWPLEGRYRLLPRAAGRGLVPTLEALLGVGALLTLAQLLT
jgi:membrane-bound metal-dependent hydrolase YbcI (DUF457 family)